MIVTLIGSALAAAASETYMFNQSQSSIGFAVHQYLGTIRGNFGKFDGKIEVDRNRPDNSSVVARIAVRSIDTGVVRRDNHLRSAEFFNAEKFPEITFKSRTTRQTGPSTGDVIGDLNMHGRTQQITLHVKLLAPQKEATRTRWSVSCELLQRHDFGLLFSSGVEAVSGISPSVSVKIEIEATRDD